MSMDLVTEGPRDAEFLLSEANGYRSREKVILDDGNLLPGTVLGVVTATGKYLQWTDDNDPAGTGVAAAVLMHAADATDGDVDVTVIRRDAEVATALLVWPTGTSDIDKAGAIAELADENIIARV